MEELKEVMNSMNDKILKEGEVRLNDAYELLGFSRFGDEDLGWWTDENGVGHFGILSTHEEIGWTQTSKEPQ